MVEPVLFDQWVHENNPNPQLSYGKGWWDFIEIHDVSVVATFVLHTPYPAEELVSPVVRLVSPQVRVFLKEDFGQFSAPWTLSAERVSSSPISHLELFLAEEELTDRCLRGFEPEWAFPNLRSLTGAFHGSVRGSL